MEFMWDKKLLDMTRFVSSYSKDRSRKVGAVIVNEDNRVLSIGYNGFPTGFNDDIDSRHTKEHKYFYTEHAERNAIYNASRLGVPTKDCKLYTSLFPCSDCARAIIQSGIVELVTIKPDMSDPRWGIQFKYAEEMLVECGVKITYYEE